MTNPIIVWFRQDLRIEDQPALHAAAQTGRPVLPVFIWSPDDEDDWALGAAARFWLHQSLTSLAPRLASRGSPLIYRSGSARDILIALAEESGADTVFWNRRYEPAAIIRDSETKSALDDSGIETKSFNGRLLLEPWTVSTKAGTPYKVFTPFYNNCMASDLDADPLPAPDRLIAPATPIESDSLESFKLEPDIDWTPGIRAAWSFGEPAAQARANDFFDDPILDYSEGRDHPADETVSRLSPHLAFGEISPRWLLHRAQETAAEHTDPGRLNQTEAFVRQLYWREFSYHLLYHYPHTPNQPLRPEFADFRWRRSTKNLKAWQQGQTGYPIVDAGMRELWQTGWMHNRVRMIVASFLIKDLLIHWRTGAEWFWDTLVDADLANNTQGWQWTAGSGADAAPYFRIFNPVSQGQRYDKDGRYIRRYVPELAALPDTYIHRPWEAPGDVLEKAGITLGKDYPKPIVDHSVARKEALNRYAEIRV